VLEGVDLETLNVDWDNTSYADEVDERPPYSD
jgi:hypothetical protein